MSEYSEVEKPFLDQLLVLHVMRSCRKTKRMVNDKLLQRRKEIKALIPSRNRV